MASMAAPHLLSIAEKYGPMLMNKAADWVSTKVSDWWNKPKTQINDIS
jgi:hypothetical protein